MKILAICSIILCMLVIIYALSIYFESRKFTIKKKKNERPFPY